MSLPAKVVVGALALFAALLAGCKMAPIYEVVAAPIPVSSGAAPLSMAEIEKAMIRGGMRAGWQMLPEAPGRMSGRYYSGPHIATVGVEYDAKAYSIKMRETSVRNDGTSVHRAYNTWVQSLDRSIRAELATIGQ
jgi:hypothetical protein